MTVLRTYSLKASRKQLCGMFMQAFLLAGVSHFVECTLMPSAFRIERLTGVKV